MPISRIRRLSMAALAALPALVAGPAPAGERETAARLLGIALVESRAYDKLAYLTDRIGHRLSGSVGLQKAVAWTTEEFKRDGIPRVWNEAVMVPHWERGEAWARIVAPIERPMAVLALGNSIPTPEAGVRGEVVVVRDFDELHALGEERVRGKIVLYSREMRRSGGPEYGYGPGSRNRVHGAKESAKLGAIGHLIRSLGTADYRLPHTGVMLYDDAIPKIPGAAISVEDALLIERLLAAGDTVEVAYGLSCKWHPDAPSANVLAEIPGREEPDEIVVIGCHLDSWDVGTGAHDDGAGCAIVMEALRLFRKHGMVARRTIRGVLFTNEENGLRGGTDYAERHADAMDRHVAAIESDLGAGRPLGFGVTAGEGGIELVRRFASYLEPIDAAEVVSPGGGADISPMRPLGVPQLGLRQDPTYYFDYHHTEADTLDKVDPKQLDRNLAALMVMTYLLADSKETLPRVPPPDDDSTRP